MSNGFSHHRFFGTIQPINLPKTLGRSLFTPENQGNTTRCAAYASAANHRYATGFRMSPDRQAICIGKVQGFTVDSGGSDPNAAMKAGRDYGYLLWDTAKLHLETDGILTTGDERNWPTEQISPIDDRDISFLKVDGNNDIFDNIRSAIFQSFDSTTQMGNGVQAFGRWYMEWDRYIIPEQYQTFSGYHSWIFIDFTEVNGIQYLIAQNSYGTSIGQGGFHLFPRSVINKEFSASGTTLKIPKAITPLQLAIAKQSTPFGIIQRQILKIWYLISDSFGL